ncbi:hypothetical protein DPMN_113446 [Dreissena polymorpha]|uniref:Uncharacterized protein n=1 Tax=Dreissena polymorpha TaxID=45954 RepID=A0A9D4KHG4_DREPO|nr:hypothetical protein DPMN_113446 [Dreissena polymorpha]
MDITTSAENGEIWDCIRRRFQVLCKQEMMSIQLDVARATQNGIYITTLPAIVSRWQYTYMYYSCGKTGLNA